MSGRTRAPRLAQTLYFLRHMSHITQSMDEEATAQLLAKLDTVKYPKVCPPPLPRRATAAAASL